MSARPPWAPLVLLLGIAAVSTASVLVRFAQQDAPSPVIAAGRLLIASLVLAPVALARHRTELRGLSARDLALGLASGVLLALHFATWIASLEFTSVVSSVVLVTTTPLWVALLAPVFLGERIARATWTGIVIAMIGGVVIAAGDADAFARAPAGEGATRGRALWGDFLALAGAWAMAGYLLAGRGLRARMHLVPYVFVVYGMAAVVLAGAALAGGHHPGAVPARAWGWIVLLALVPQLLGHSSFNWALRYLPAAFVAIVLLGEPVGSAVLAFAVLGEMPSAVTLAGALLVLAGIAIASHSAGREVLAES